MTVTSLMTLNMTFFSNGNKDSLATWYNKQSTSLIIRTAWEVLSFSYGKGPFLRPISQMEINLVFYEFLSKQQSTLIKFDFFRTQLPNYNSYLKEPFMIFS